MKDRTYKAQHAYTCTEWEYTSKHRNGSKANLDDARAAALKKYGRYAGKWQIIPLGLVKD